ncbi:MAG: DUF2079 domain-containing protein [Cryomorphaceae bacterium]|nr:DUF2079 domain-containing protein [Cryomorphaceae bacterium]
MFRTLSLKNVFVVVIVAAVAALISFPNHFTFRTYALDLGLYTNIAWGYLNGTTSGFQMLGIDRHPFADHADFYLLFFAPIVLILGSVGLLIAQWVAVVIAAFKSLRIGDFTTDNWLFPLYMLALWPLSNALAYDYHSVLISAMLWLGWWHASANGKWRASWIFLIFIWLGKENMPLWMAFSTSGFAFLYPQFRKQVLAQTAASILVFIFILGAFMPWFSSGESVSNLGKYSLLGTSASSALQALGNPGLLLEALWHSKANGRLITGDVKIEFWIFFALSGGWLFIRKPAYMWMIIPIILQKMWHDNERFGGTIGHYSIELLPVMLVAGIDFYKSIPNKKVFILALVLPALLVTFRSMDRPVDRSNQAQIRFYKKTHYYRKGQTESHALLQLIPSNASISAMSPVVPHFACRNNIYQYPTKSDDAAFLVLMKTEQCFPMPCEERDQDLKMLKENNSYELFGETDLMAVFKRK